MNPLIFTIKILIVMGITSLIGIVLLVLYTLWLFKDFHERDEEFGSEDFINVEEGQISNEK